MYQGWFSLGGLEVGNNARAYGYSTTAACPVYWLAEDDCMALRDRMLGGPFGVETIRDAPWYDPNDPVISEDFLGAYVVSMEGLSDSTRSSTTTQRTGPGGRIGRSRDATRQVRTRMWLTAASMAGLEFGMNWLSASLSESACGAHNTSCGTASMEFYDSCPPERGFVEDFTEWELAATNLATHGTFEKAGPLVTVRENFVTNPSFETAGPPVTVRENYALPFPNAGYNGLTSTLTEEGAGYVMDFADSVANLVVPSSGWIPHPPVAGQPYSAAYTVENRGSTNVDLRVAFWDGGAYQYGPVFAIEPGQRQRIAATMTATESSSYIQPRIHGVGGGGGPYKVYLTEPTFEVGPVAGLYFNGNTPPKVRRNRTPGPIPNANWGMAWGDGGAGTLSTSFLGGMSMRVAEWTTEGTGTRRMLTNHTPSLYVKVAEGEVLPMSILAALSGSSAQVRIGIDYYGPSSWISAHYSNYVSVSSIPTAPTRLKFTPPPAPAGVDNMRVYVFVGNGTTPTGTKLYATQLLVGDNGDYFDGSSGAPEGYATAWEGTPNASPSYMYDDDFTVEWSGTPNASASLLRGVSVAGWSGSSAVGIMSTFNGEPAMRVIRTGAAIPQIYTTGVTPNGGVTGLVRAGRKENVTLGAGALVQENGGSYRSVPLITPAQSSAMPVGEAIEFRAHLDVAGQMTTRLRLSAPADYGESFYYLNALIMPGPYSGSYFDGDTPPMMEIAGGMRSFLPDGKMVIGWASHDLTTLAAEEQAFGTNNGVISTYSDFVNQPQFPVDYAQAAVDRSAALLIAWEPWDWNAPIGQQPTFAPRVVAGGAHDEHISDWLSEAQSWTSKIPVWVRFAPEMNDTARPWAVGIGTSGYAEATPAEYIDMWRHVYAIKQQVAPDVQMMWNPLNFGAGAHEFEEFYPGDEYVDSLALNGFNWSDVQGTTGWQDSTAVFGFNDPVNGPVPRLKALANGKPWGLAEVASAPDNPADFLPGGQFYDSYGSWVFDWPENPPYEETADDWITQHGFTEMMMRRAADEGASFVALFHTNKETDWRLTDTAEGRAVMSKALAWSPNVIDQLPVAPFGDLVPDPDFTVAWSGTPNASTSLLQGVSVDGWSTTRCLAIQSTRYLGAGGAKSMRIISTSPTGGECYARLDVPAAIRATQGATIVATSIFEEVADYRAGTIQFGSAPWSRSPSGRYDVGAEHIRFFADPAHAVTNFRLYGARIMGDPDVWWTDVGLFEGNYDGPYFSGDTEETSVTQYAWTGEPNASESTMEVRESFIRPRTDEEWGELLDQRRRFLHGVKCVSGPFVVQERESSTGAVGRLVEFTLESEVPYVFGAMRTLELPSITPTVVQDVVHNLAPYPSAELAGDPVVVSENLSTNPSLELDATGWSHLVSGSGLTATSGRVTGELAAVGDASFRVVGTASGSGTSGYLAARQTVDLPAVTGRRFSISIWAAQLIVSGLPVQGVMEARAIWRNGTTVLRTDALGSIDINGGAVSASSISPPASATNVIVEVRANLASWSSGDVVRLYADALAVTTP